MPVVSEGHLKLAIANVSAHGDTDIFPYPVENHVFHDMPDDVLNVLTQVDSDFDGLFRRVPVLNSKNLAAAGYNGFRLGTQIDPLWNAYLLGLVIAIGPDIEARRVSQDIVFSYRFQPDLGAGSIFSNTVGWREFQAAAVARAKGCSYVLRCDISDFYQRIYHHRLENALNGATTNGEAVKRIMAILGVISEGRSYGLPIGGPAARLLSELLLNRVDRLLLTESVSYCRFVDDYIIFASSREAAHSALISLSTLLLMNEGLSLQKSKTRLMTAAEFLSTSEFADPDPDGESTQEEEEHSFRRLRIHYDPYSPTAPADYERLVDELKRFDIVGMLGRQLAKSRIDEGLTRRLIQAIRHLEPHVKSDAVQSLLDSLDLLYPIFPTVMLLFRSLLPHLPDPVRERMFSTLRGLLSSNSYITQVPAHVAFAIRVLAADRSEEATIVLSNVYKLTNSMLVKRDVILVLAYRGIDYWISNCKNSFSTLSGWERRALLMSSYILGDEGAHWRRAVKDDQHMFDQLILRWAGESKSRKGPSWNVPI